MSSALIEIMILSFYFDRKLCVATSVSEQMRKEDQGDEIKIEELASILISCLFTLLACTTERNRHFPLHEIIRAVLIARCLQPVAKGN